MCMRDKRENITECDTRHGDATKNKGNKLKKEEKQRRKYLKAVSKEEKRRRKYLKTVSKIKKKARSELTNWSQYGYCLKDSMMDLGVDDGGSVLEIDGLGVSFAEFSHTIEKRHVPCLIHSLLKHWPAMKRWNSVERLMEQLKGVACKVGSDDDGYAVRMLFEHFVEYLRDPEHGKKDDSPLYIFDSTLVEKTTLKHDFIVPYIFSEDLLKYAGKSRRPPHQWMCIGGPRSGTSIHVDPLGTSAWNALVCGHKRWAMFPPGSGPEEVLKPKGVNSAARWFDVVLPKTLLDSWEYHKPLHVVQGPGDVIFVPSGWWHVVINLDFTVAVTENFCSTANFHKVFMHTRISRPKMTQRWLASLRTVRPDLARVGQQIINDDERCSDISSPSSSSTSSGGSGSDDENSASS